MINETVIDLELGELRLRYPVGTTVRVDAAVGKVTVAPWREVAARSFRLRVDGRRVRVCDVRAVFELDELRRLYPVGTDVRVGDAVGKVTAAPWYHVAADSFRLGVHRRRVRVCDVLPMNVESRETAGRDAVKNREKPAARETHNQ